MNQEFSYIFYTFFKNLPEMEEKSPWFLSQTHHMYADSVIPYKGSPCNWHFRWFSCSCSCTMGWGDPEQICSYSYSFEFGSSLFIEIYMLMVCVLQISFWKYSCLFLISLSILAFPAKLHAIRVLLCEICQIIPSPKLFVLGFCIAVNFI